MPSIRKYLAERIEDKTVEIFDRQQPGDRQADRWRERLIDAADVHRRRPKQTKKSGAGRKRT